MAASTAQTVAVRVDGDDQTERQPDSARLQKLDEAERQLQKAQAELRKALKELHASEAPAANLLEKRILRLDEHEGPLGLAIVSAMTGGAGRLGVHIERPNAVLADQLDLPADQGMVIIRVEPDSAAAKAAIKKNDILLELAGKPVPRDPQLLVKAVAEIKAGQVVDAVVLRKGKKEVIKGLALPEKKDVSSLKSLAGLRALEALPGIQGELAVPGKALQRLVINRNGPGEGGIMTTMFRTGDRFTARHQEGNLVVTVTGNSIEGKPRVNEIHVQDGSTSNTYDSVDKVPERYRDKVKNLVEMSEKANAKVEVKTP
jgi:hypothetical protein